jgi:hypothetical protein
MKILESVSRLLNTLIGGSEYESLSSRMYREDRKIAIKVINCIFFWQQHHCRGAYNNNILKMKQYLKDK